MESVEIGSMNGVHGRKYMRNVGVCQHVQTE